MSFDRWIGSAGDRIVYAGVYMSTPGPKKDGVNTMACKREQFTYECPVFYLTP